MYFFSFVKKEGKGYSLSLILDLMFYELYFLSGESKMQLIATLFFS